MDEAVTDISPESIIGFWFDDTDRRLWFRSTPDFDGLIRARFSEIWQAARDGRLAHWEGSPGGALALVIVLDQFPLHIFRNEPESFATEAAARRVADAAVRREFDRYLPGEQAAFLYLPFMHSESLADQERSVSLFEAAGLEENLRWARHHRDIIRRFGRFPHRNEILGRPSTAEELEWLHSPGAFRG